MTPWIVIQGHTVAVMQTGHYLLHLLRLSVPRGSLPILWFCGRLYEMASSLNVRAK